MAPMAPREMEGGKNEWPLRARVDEKGALHLRGPQSLGKKLGISPGAKNIQAPVTPLGCPVFFDSETEDGKEFGSSEPGRGYTDEG